MKYKIEKIDVLGAPEQYYELYEGRSLIGWKSVYIGPMKDVLEHIGNDFSYDDAEEKERRHQEELLRSKINLLQLKNIIPPEEYEKLEKGLNGPNP